MSISVELMNTSSLTELAKEKTLTGRARSFEGVLSQGYLLAVTDGDQEWVVSTYLSDSPKLYKKADALLKEAKKMGVTEVTFKF